jgi:hypothetical protein
MHEGAPSGLSGPGGAASTVDGDEEVRLSQHSVPRTDDERTAGSASEPTDRKTAASHPDTDTPPKPPLETDVHGAPDTPV